MIEIIGTNGIHGYLTNSRAIFFDIAIKYIPENGKVLDVGCGNGSFAVRAERKDMHMLDASPETIQKLKKEFPNTVEGRADALPFSNKTFDFVHASHVVEHMPQDSVYLFMKECRRCIKPGGVLVISASVLWHGFYADLSHIRPYNPGVFTGYLCGSDLLNHTRKLIGGFKVVDTVWRFSEEPVMRIDGDKTEKDTKYIRTGYTLILQADNITEQ